MNGSLFPGIPLNPQINYGRAILFAPGNPQVLEQKTIRIVDQQQQQQHYLPKRPQEMLEPTVRIHSRRPTPYERPVKNELNKPLRITKRVTTTVEIDNPKGYISQDLLERTLGITNGENIFQVVEEDTPSDVIEVEVSSKENEIKIKKEEEDENKTKV